MTKAIKTLLALGLIASAATASAQQPPPQFPNMSFFVTSAASPKGGDLGGLAGADKICQDLAAKAGAGAKTWRAYLSTQAVGGATGAVASTRG